jgi:integrase
MGNESTKRDRVKLTTAKVQRLTEPGYYWDDTLKGFCVRVSPGGARTYLARYRTRHGRQRWAKVGEHPTNTADEARGKALEVLGAVKKGEDPAQARDDDRKAATVKDLVDKFKADHTAKKAEATKKAYERQLERFVLPAIGPMPVKAIEERDILAILSKLTGTPIQKNRVQALLSKLFSVAESLGDRTRGTNPCRGIKREHEDSRQRFLTDAELLAVGEVLEAEQALAEQKLEAMKQGNKALARAIDAEDLTPILAIKFLLFSGRRKNEALTLRWDQVDLDTPSMRINTKTGELTVDINGPMLEVLKVALRHRTLGNPFVFPGKPEKPKPGEKKPEPKPWVNLMKPWNRVLEAAGVWPNGSARRKDKPTIHDIRRTFGTVGTGDVELPHETIGKVLGHKQTKTTQIYARLAGKKRAEASERIGAAMAKKLKKQA